MITLKEWMEVVDYRITEGDNFGWNCFGGSAYSLSAWSGTADGWSFNITFDTGTQVVYIVEACDYKHNRAYRLINPDWTKQFHTEADRHNPKHKNEAWDDVDFVDLEVDDDWIQKALAIKSGENYDTRISVPVEFSDEELLKYMKLAHERDITFNQLVEEAIRAAIKDFERDPEGMKVKAKAWTEQKHIEPHGY
jgi:hypothetical protein